MTATVISFADYKGVRFGFFRLPTTPREPSETALILDKLDVAQPPDKTADSI